MDLGGQFSLIVRERGRVRTLREIIEYLSSGGSMVARLKLKGIDGGAPQGVELAA